jgi:outer membrane protein
MCIVFMGSFAKAQVKIGYINQGDLVQAMPELKTVNTQLDAYKKQFIDQLTTMNNELQTKGQAYQSKQATMTDAAKTAAQSELNDINKRTQEFQQNAQQQVEAKGNDLMKPILDKIHVAIDAVAKEKGYSYVLDSSQVQLLVSPPSDDMMASVKLKLGLK